MQELPCEIGSFCAQLLYPTVTILLHKPIKPSCPLPVMVSCCYDCRIAGKLCLIRIFEIVILI